MAHEPVPRVSAVVLNYNGRRLLEIVLPSLAAQEYGDFEMLVVDNCSSDDSVPYLRERWPQVRVVEVGPRNLGVAAALNRGVAAAKGELVALLNNDLELERTWLNQLVLALDRHPDAGSASGKLLNYARRDELDGAADLLTRDGIAHRRGHGQVDLGQFDSPEEVFAPTAGAGLYRARALDEVGAFDESFHAYYEDVDWGLRAQLLGYRCRYVPTAVAYHMGSATTGGEQNRLFFMLQRRNQLAVLIKDLPLGLLAWYLPRILWGQLQMGVRSARAGMLGIHLRALAEVLRNAPSWLRARKEIQHSRTIGARELMRLMRAWSND
jgi:GT2 family glycosyltransferase